MPIIQSYPWVTSVDNPHTVREDYQRVMELQTASIQQALSVSGFVELYSRKEEVKELQDQVDHLTNLVETLYTRLEKVGILKSEV